MKKIKFTSIRPFVRSAKRYTVSQREIFPATVINAAKSVRFKKTVGRLKTVNGTSMKMVLLSKTPGKKIQQVGAISTLMALWLQTNGSATLSAGAMLALTDTQSQTVGRKIL